MSSSLVSDDLIPLEVAVDESMIRVKFSGGLEIATPVSRFPRLASASAAQRKSWRRIGRGDGIHWPEVDEDISVRTLLSQSPRKPVNRMEEVPVLIGDLLKTTQRLNKLFHGRPFTPDGHLVGSIGEVVAEYIYDLSLEPCSTPQIDARTKDGITVQVKLTGETGQTYAFRWPPASNGEVPHMLLCLKLTQHGFRQIYNGTFPNALLDEKVPQKNGQVRLSIATLQALKSEISLPLTRSFDEINRWFIPELAEVA